MKKYYKITHQVSILFFYHDLDKDRLDGLVEETRTEDKVCIQRHKSIHCYDNVSNNTLAQNMLKKAVECDVLDYSVAQSVADSMIDSTMWLIGDNETSKEVVSETVYV